jgi:hypothetical protein
MTPHIVRNPGDMERLKQAEFARVSWCEADIFAMHGDVFPKTGLIQEWQEEDESVPVIYPDVDPRGSLQPSDINTQNATVYSGELPAPVVVNPSQTAPAAAPKSSAGLLRLPRTIKPNPN